MSYREKARFKGVYKRTSKKTKFQGRPDICFDIAYRTDGRLIWEKVGWVSEGYSDVLAQTVRSERIRSIRHSEELPHQKKKVLFFKELASKYLVWAKSNKAREGREDESNYKNHLADRLGGRRLNEISPLDLEKMKTELTGEGLAPATVKHCLILVRQMFNKALAWGLYQGANPVKKVKLPVPQNQRERYLSFEEAGTLLNELLVKSQTAHDMALLSLQTGLRFGEITNIKGHDLDFENGLITIINPKNKETRKASMTIAVKKLLGQRISKNPMDYIFKDRWHGERVQMITGVFKRAANDLFNEGVTDPRQRVTFHTLRHTFASWLASQGTPILTISQLLGHKSLAMTLRYSHLSPDHKREAVLDLEQMFNKKLTNK
jgi:integrase